MTDESRRWKPTVIIAGDGEPRHLLISDSPPRVSVAVGLLEVQIRVSRKPPNTRRNVVSHCAYLYTWADLYRLDLDQRLMSGRPLSELEKESFMHWIASDQAARRQKALSSPTIQNIVHSCVRLSLFCLKRYMTLTGPPEERAAKSLLVVESERQAWNDLQPAVDDLPTAPDLTDEERNRIDAYLNPDTRSDVPIEIVIRDALIWRFSSRLGMRIGEILALRLCDCPDLPGAPLKIVRVQHRGKAYRDPRAQYAPRPKTKTRDLSLQEDPLLPGLLALYRMAHRHRSVGAGGSDASVWDLGHDFLIINHRTGQPLSTSRAQQISKQISAHSGVAFHWHLGRHSYFNREYAAIYGKSNFLALRDTLQYKGGWRDPRSLAIYTRRIVRDQAQGYISDHQSGLDGL